ncbi:Ig-like domain-containing protein [Salmonella enterica]|nr:Ig-like domain-containing protein [Salmonella enterica]
MAEVTASVDGQSYSKAVTLTPDESTASVNGLTVKETSVPADGRTANTLTATVVDAGGNPVQGVTVDWSKSSGVNASLAGNTSMTNERGEATMEVTGTAAETAGIQAKVGANAGDAGQSADAVFTLYPVVGVTVTKDNVSADGTTAGTVEVTVKDLAGAPVAGQAVTLTTASGVTASSTGVTDADGKLSVDVTSTVSGVTDVAASVGAGDRQEATAQLNFGRYVRFDGLTLTHTPPTTDATNAGKMCQADCEITLSAMVTDAGGNPVPGVDVHFQGSVTGDDALVVASGTDGMVSVTRKYDKGGVEDVSLVAASQGVTIGTSAANNIDILYTITRNGVHADPTGPMLRSSLTFMGPKTPVNSYPTNLDPAVATAGSYRCTATAKYVWQHASDGPFTAVVEANGKTNSKGECEMVDEVQDSIDNAFRKPSMTNPANYALYWPVTACRTNTESANFCGTYVWGSGSGAFATSDTNVPSGLPLSSTPRVSQSALPDGVGVTANVFLDAWLTRFSSYWLGYPGALKVAVTPGTVDAAGVVVNGPLFTDAP